LRETLPNGVTFGVLDILDGPMDHTRAFEVPDGHVFVLGDNRDNSADSRIPQASGGIGFIPLKNIIGIVELEPK
jgi:signal peptidase I